MPKIDDNGIVRDMTEQEIAEMEKMAAEMPVAEPGMEERVKALEDENAALKAQLDYLVNDAEAAGAQAAVSEALGILGGEL